MLEQIITAIPEWTVSHAKTTSLYSLMETMSKQESRERFSDITPLQQPFGPFGTLCFPYFKMGAIDTVDLFGLDELIIFSFYWVNRHRYKTALDLGANLGLHSILLSKAGYSVQAYEPDPIHFDLLSQNLVRNGVKTVTAHLAAVSNHNGTAFFTRVKGNTTSSHLTGSKNPYGELETFEVKVVDIRDLIKGIDLVKMDVEGHEVEVLNVLTASDLQTTDIMMEVSTIENRVKVYQWLSQNKISAFSQKKGWNRINHLEDLPATHREGSLFVTLKSQMPWG